LAVWTSRRSVQVGHLLGIGGRVTAPAPTAPTPVAIQLWEKGWRTVSHGVSSSNGVFHKKIKLALHGGSRIARIRVVAPAALPSRNVAVRVRG
jgi:hypothetical protein